MNELIDLHYNWLASMGYDKTRPLEALALITSEIGEAVNECRNQDGSITDVDHFGEELADIVLRVMGVARQHNIDLETLLRNKITKNISKGNKGRTI